MAKSRKASRGGGRTRDARSTGARGSRKAPPRSTLADQVRSHRRAIERIGKDRVKPGVHKVATSRALTPTTRGFRAVSKALDEMRRDKSAVYTYRLFIKKGKKTEELQIPSNIVTMKGRRTTFMKRLRAQVYTSPAYEGSELGGGSASFFSRFRGGKRAARKAFQAKVRRAGIRFKITIERHG